MADRFVGVHPFVLVISAAIYVVLRAGVPAECQQQQDAESSPQVELRCYSCDHLCSDTVGQYEVSVTETINMINSDGSFEPCVTCYTRMLVSGNLERGCLTQSDIDGEVFPIVTGSGCAHFTRSGNTSFADSVCLCEDSFCNNHQATDLVLTADNTILNNGCSSSGVTLTSSISGYIVSPGWPEQYGNNEDCVWIIQPDGATEYTRIGIDIIEFKTERTHDKLLIYDGSSISSPVIANINGSGVAPNEYLSSSSTVLLSFTSDGSVTDDGFQLMYTITTDNTTLTSRCSSSGVALTSNIGGYIVSPGWPKQYGNNEDCVWIIQPDGATDYTRIWIDIIEFKTERTHDKLIIYDGPSSSSSVISSISGSDMDSTEYLSSGSTALLSFTSDGSVMFKGFRLKYTVIEDKTISRTATSSTTTSTTTSRATTTTTTTTLTATAPTTTDSTTSRATTTTTTTLTATASTIFSETPTTPNVETSTRASNADGPTLVTCYHCENCNDINVSTKTVSALNTTVPCVACFSYRKNDLEASVVDVGRGCLTQEDLTAQRFGPGTATSGCIHVPDIEGGRQADVCICDDADLCNNHGPSDIVASLETSTTTTVQEAPEKANDKSGSSVGIIVTATVVAVLVIIVMAVVFYCVFKRYKRKLKNEPEPSSDESQLERSNSRASRISKKLSVFYKPNNRESNLLSMKTEHYSNPYEDVGPLGKPPTFANQNTDDDTYEDLDANYYLTMVNTEKKIEQLDENLYLPMTKGETKKEEDVEANQYLTMTKG